MAVKQIIWNSYCAWGNAVHTFEVNLPPDWYGAQVSLYGTHGDGTSYTGVAGYRKRLASGADEPHVFGYWYAWPPVVFDFLSSVTFGVATVSGQQAWMLTRLDRWG